MIGLPDKNERGSKSKHSLSWAQTTIIHTFRYLENPPQRWNTSRWVGFEWTSWNDRKLLWVRSQRSVWGHAIHSKDGTELHPLDLCVAAVLIAVKEVIGNPDWASLCKKSARISAGKVDDSKESEKEPSLPASSKPATRTINKAHFREALEQVLPSYSGTAQDELYKWHETYSSDANGATRDTKKRRRLY